ncbi:MAG: 2-oxoglutarate and iron-dependent oxygenase domain-containing protein [Janthinobacterium lividum]
MPKVELSQADNPRSRAVLMLQLRSALFDVGFSYITNHGVPQQTISNLTDLLPSPLDLPEKVRSSMSKLNSPHFLRYSGFAEEVTLGKHDLREQFDMATELPIVWQEPHATDDHSSKSRNARNFADLHWRLRGSSQWPPEDLLPGFRKANTESDNFAYRPRGIGLIRLPAITMLLLTSPTVSSI